MPDNTDDLDALDAELAQMSEEDDDGEFYDAALSKNLEGLGKRCNQEKEFAQQF